MAFEHATYIGIDYGTRRIGVAISDPSGLVASAVTTLEVKSDRDALAKVAALLAEHAPDGVVFGYPLLASGDKSEKCKEIDRFIERLKPEYAGPVHLYDEYGTSEDAQKVIHAHGKKAGRKKGRIDRIAAVLILQRFLDEELPRLRK